MSKPRQRITTDVFKTEDGREFIITFKTDGIHIHEKFARGGDRVIGLRELVANSLANIAFSTKSGPTKANPEFKDGSIAESLDVAACDLCELARSVHAKTVTGGEVAEVKKSLAKAQGIIRSLEVSP